MKKIKQDVQQICFALQRGEISVEDAKQLAEDLDQNIVRTRRRTIVLGTVLVILSFFLAGIVCRQSSHRPEIPPPPAKKPSKFDGLAYVPKHALPLDSLWVINYQQKDLHSDIPVLTNLPFSEEWVKHAAYHLILGRQALEENMLKEAAVHLEEAVTIFPQIKGIHSVLGTVYLQMDRPQAAIEHLEAALEEERNLSVLNNLGAALIKTGELDRAKEFLDQANQLDPGYPGGLKNMALLYRQKEQPEKALKYFEDYLAQYHEDIETVEIYANYLNDLGHRDQSIKFLSNYNDLNTEKALPLYLMLAKFEAESTNTTATVAALEKITSLLSPNLALIKLNMDDFDSIRNTEEFQSLVQQVELAAVTLEEK